MTRLVAKHLVAVLMGGAVAAATSGCTTGAQLRAQAEEIQQQNKQIHDRAYRCAPKEIAVAESEVDFGLYELRQGNFTRARDHIFRAEEYSKLADKYSKHDSCTVEDGEIEVEQAEAAQIEEGPRDQDGDGLNDSEDECPQEPEDFDGFEDEDGCPDTDNDQDGIADTEDACPNVPEGEPDGYRDDDGCPDPDNDQDGIADVNDNCPGDPEDFDGFEDEDGCPDTDNDEDGIADTLDECPNQAEDYDGDRDDDGCPEERKRVTVEKEQIKLDQKVHFAYDKAKIQSQSYPLLDEVADVLEDNPNIEVRIEGHTDSQGSEDYNEDLSQRRAQSVVDYLVDQGVSRERMTAKGFGESQPIESNATEAGRAANRRVEIHITNR